MKKQQCKETKISKQKNSTYSSTKLELNEFIEKIKSIEIEVCECNKCIFSIKRLYSLVHKIANNIDLAVFINDADKLDDNERLFSLDLLAVSIAICIINPDFLYSQIWHGNYFEGNKNSLNYIGVEFMKKFKYNLVDYSQLLTDEEKIEFGDSLLFIAAMYKPAKCKNCTTYLYQDEEVNYSSAMLN